METEVIEHRVSRDGRVRLVYTRRPSHLEQHDVFATPMFVTKNGAIIDPRWDIIEGTQQKRRPWRERIWQVIPDGIIAAYRHFLHIEADYRGDELPLLQAIEAQLAALYPLYRWDWNEQRFLSEGDKIVDAVSASIPDLLYARNPDKQRMRNALLKIKEQRYKDNRGRPNPMAFAMVVHGALFRTDKRRQSVSMIQVQHAARKVAAFNYWARQADYWKRLVATIATHLSFVKNATEKKQQQARLTAIYTIDVDAMLLDVEPFYTIGRMARGYAVLLENEDCIRTIEGLSLVLELLKQPAKSFERYRAELTTLHTLIAKHKRWTDVLDGKLIRQIEVLQHQPTPPWSWLGEYAAQACLEACRHFRQKKFDEGLLALHRAIMRLWVFPKDAEETTRYPADNRRVFLQSQNGSQASYLENHQFWVIYFI